MRPVTSQVDLGLALLRRKTPPGQSYPLSVIAIWAGCSPENIRQIEEKALKNITLKLKGLEER